MSSRLTLVRARPETRFLLYSHDSFGLGHLRRSMSIAAALTQEDAEASVLCATGSPAAELFALPPRCELVRLPSIRKQENGRYEARSLPGPLERVTHVRTELILALLRSYRPHVLLVDHTAVGPGRELVPVLESIRRSRCATQVVLGMRDVLDSPERAKREIHDKKIVSALERLYDHVLVYGDSRILDLVAEYGLPESVAAKLTYVGLVHPPTGFPSSTESHGNGKQIVVCAGGGEDGYELFDRAVAALSCLPDPELRATLVAGPLMAKESFARLTSLAGSDARLSVHQASREMPFLLAESDLVIGMGGYNTVYESLALGRRLLVVPRPGPRREQIERARRLADLGVLHWLDPEVATTAGSFAAAIARSLATPLRPLADTGISTTGAQTTARALITLARAGQLDGTPVRQSRSAAGGA